MKTSILAAIFAFSLSFIFCKALIPILRKIKLGQNILSYVKEHKEKGGTPTMGGIAFLSAAVLSTIILYRGSEKRFTVSLAIGISYMLVGFLDDLLKKKHKENLGLRAWQKLLFQLSIAVLAGIYSLKEGLTILHLPFFNQSIDIDFWIVPLAVFVFIATVNAVNLTDGLDGLAAGVSAPYFGVLGILIFLQEGKTGLSMLSFALMGALVAYLLFNVAPAYVFMGDTGSLSLGGFAASITLFSGNALYLPIVGACFVFSVISVIIQVIYYKASKGKRIFLMAPAHHHFQEKGYSENRISYAYFVITIVLGAICIVNML